MKNRKKRRPASVRSKLVDEWRVSGKSQREFSREHGVNTSTFAGWVRQLELSRRSTKTALVPRPTGPKVGFSEVRVVEERPRQKASLVEVTTPGGYVVRVTGQVDPSMLRELLEEVAQC